MWTKLGMAAILAAFLASTAGLGYARAADGRATEGGATGNGGPAVGGGVGPSGTELGGGDRSIHTKPSMNEPTPRRAAEAPAGPARLLLAPRPALLGRATAPRRPRDNLNEGDYGTGIQAGRNRPAVGRLHDHTRSRTRRHAARGDRHQGPSLPDLSALQRHHFPALACGQACLRSPTISKSRKWRRPDQPVSVG